jgi:RNA polymerase sigma-70 factor (ECF subfamily)
VVQTVFVEIYKNAAQFDASRGILKTWVLQYAYSRSINRRQYLEHRQFYSQSTLDQVEPLRFPADEAPLHGLSSSEAGMLVRQALGSLNEDQRTAIELVYLQGLTMEEAAEKTGETLAALRHHYYRGLTKMRELINAGSAAQAVKSQGAGTLGLEVAHLRPRTI